MILPALILLFLLLPVYLTVDLKNVEPEVKIKLAFIDITGAVLKEDKPEKETEKTEKKHKKADRDSLPADLPRRYGGRRADRGALRLRLRRRCRA